jgi:hypothetical protein
MGPAYVSRLRLCENFLYGFKAAPRGRSRRRLGRRKPSSRFAPARLASTAGRLARKAKPGAAEPEEVDSAAADLTREPSRRRPSSGIAGRREASPIRAQAYGPPPLVRVARIRRDRYDITGALISKEVVHAVTSLDADQASAADLAAIARGQWGIESVHWLRDTHWTEDANRLRRARRGDPASWPA